MRAIFTLGVPDSSLVPLLQQHLRVSGAEVRFGPGTPLSQSEPAQLLSLVGNYLQNRNYIDFAALVRHPVLRRLVAERQPELGDNWLADIDRYYTEVLPRTVETWVNDQAKGAAAYVKVVQLVTQWLQPLTVDRLRIDQWTKPLLALLQTAYAQQSCSSQDADEERLAWSCRSVAEAIVALRDIPEALTLSLSPAEAIDWVLQSLAGQLVPQPASPSAIEMLGWLDLTLDDAPALIITGIHDGVVPEAVNADPFLPNQLRRQLGMIDNSRRYARDMYAFQVMLHSRQYLRIVVGRNNLNGDPLVPSRLLLACDLAETAGACSATDCRRDVGCIARSTISLAARRAGAHSSLYDARPRQLAHTAAYKCHCVSYLFGLSISFLLEACLPSQDDR